MPKKKKENVSKVVSARVVESTHNWITGEAKKLKISKSAFVKMKLDELCQQQQGDVDCQQVHVAVATSLSLNTMSPFVVTSINVTWGNRGEL